MINLYIGDYIKAVPKFEQLTDRRQGCMVCDIVQPNGQYCQDCGLSLGMVDVISVKRLDFRTMVQRGMVPIAYGEWFSSYTMGNDIEEYLIPDDVGVILKDRIIEIDNDQFMDQFQRKDGMFTDVYKDFIDKITPLYKTFEFKSGILSFR